MSTEIRANVDSILAQAGIIYNANFVCTKQTGLSGEKWENDQFICVFFSLGKQKTESFDFFMGIGHREVKRGFKYCGKPGAKLVHGQWQVETPKAPHAADVLHSVILDSSACEQSFADWCADFGYDTDSRKAFATYEACQQNFDKFKRIVKRETIEALREALQDY